MMAVRKRNVQALPVEKIGGQELGDRPSKRSSLVEEGLRLFQVVQQEEYKNEQTFRKCLKCFLQASKQGNEEATLWIKSFLESMSTLPPSTNVPEDLLQKMKLTTQSSEKDDQIRIVAKTMFSKLADGDIAIPKDKIEERASSILPSGESKAAKPNMLLSIKRIMRDSIAASGTKQVEEAAFVETAVRYARGQTAGPSQPGGTLDLDPDVLEDFRNANILKKVFSYPWQTLRYVKSSLWKSIEKRGMRWIWSSIPTNQLYLLLLAYILPMLTVSFIVSSVFTVIFGVAFCSMILSTLQLMADSEKAFLLSEYSNVFDYFSESKLLGLIGVQSQLIRHALIPYITFFLSLTVVVLSVGLALQQIMIYELLTLLTAGMSLFVFLQFEMYRSPVVMATVLTRSISVIYVFVSIASTISVLPEYLHFLSHLPSQFLSLQNLYLSIVNPLQISVQGITIAYLIYSQAWQNFFTGLGPCAIFLCWWLMCRDFLSYCSPTLLVQVGTIGLVLLSLSPFFPLIFLVSPVLIGFYYGISQQFFISLSFVTIVSLSIVIFAFSFNRLKEAKWLNIPADYLVIVPVILAIPCFLLGSSFYANIHEPPSLDTVTVKQYMEYCGPNNWINENMVQTQLNCIHLEDRVLEGNGNVSSVKINRIINDRKTTLSSLPKPMRTALTCLFGQTEAMCGDRKDMLTCVDAGCNFHHSLEYEFEIVVQMYDIDEPNSSIKASLVVSSMYKQIILQIKAGMLIRFNASFLEGMGSDKLTLKTLSLLVPNVTLDENDNIHDPEELKEHLLTNIFNSLKRVVYFMADVVFGYTSF